MTTSLQERSPDDLNESVILSLAKALGYPAEAAVTLRRRSDAMVVRLILPNEQSLIAKFWSRPGISGQLRRWSRTGSVQREWRALGRLAAHGVSVPKRLAYRRLQSDCLPYTDALVLEDLGECQPAIEYIKPLVRKALWDQVVALENELIELTARIIESHVVDTDHGLVNIVVDQKGRPFRLDFELARWVPSIHLASRSVGIMIGRMVGTYAFAMQPDVSRIGDFAERMRARIKPSRSMLHQARAFVEAMMERQVRQQGIHTAVQLDW